MNITEKVEAMLDTLVDWRRHLWEHHGIRDAPPSIGWLVEGDNGYEHAPNDMVADLYRQAGDGDTASVIFSVLSARAAEHSFTRFREVVFMTESYGYEGDDRPPSNLEKDFQTNPASKVTEQMTLMIAADDLVGGVEVAVGMQPFSISDGGQMVFGEPKVYGPDAYEREVQGRIVEPMKWGVLHAHEG